MNLAMMQPYEIISEISRSLSLYSNANTNANTYREICAIGKGAFLVFQGVPTAVRSNLYLQAQML